MQINPNSLRFKGYYGIDTTVVPEKRKDYELMIGAGINLGAAVEKFDGRLCYDKTGHQMGANFDPALDNLVKQRCASSISRGDIKYYPSFNLHEIRNSM